MVAAVLTSGRCGGFVKKALRYSPMDGKARGSWTAGDADRGTCFRFRRSGNRGDHSTRGRLPGESVGECLDWPVSGPVVDAGNRSSKTRLGDTPASRQAG